MRDTDAGPGAMPATKDLAISSLPLSDLAAERSAAVVGIAGGYDLVSRLVALGFTPGARVTVLRNSGRSAMIVSVLDTRIALGRGQACSVRIRPVE